MVLGAAEDPSERPANNSRERLERRILGPRKGKDEDEIDAALMDLERLKSRSDDLDHNGWYGILHADGNGMGRVFQNLSEAYATGEEILRQEKKLSADLDEIVWGAVGDAIVEVQRTGPDAGRAKGPNGNTIPYKDWILPIIVGGDDISAVLSGRMALSFAIALSQAYETRIQTKPDFGGALRKLAEKKVDVPKKLSLGLGLIFVKPHHPFSHAIQLAEDLTGMAKKKSDNASMLAFHVLHEPSVRRWDDLHSRDEWKPGVPAAPDAAPLVIPVGLRETTDDPSSTRREGPIHHRLFEGTPTTTLEKLWYLMRLCDSRVPLGEDETRETDARFSRSSLHRLRAVLSTPAPDEETYEARIAPVMSQLGLWEKRMKIPLEERDFLRKNRRLLVPALDALDMERGTAA
ncbi:MAG: hypothetical protein LBM23_02315 [Propionibacteriaceae bacterium]|nr:hypothetical protein [Propionibacteriaceae bacterium]